MRSILRGTLGLLAFLAAGTVLLPSAARALAPFQEAFLRGYVMPRSYPDSSISDSTRVRAYRAIVQARSTLGLGHRSSMPVDSLAPSVPSIIPCMWRSIGPTNVNGRVTSIAFDPDDATRVFAATVGGIWRSTSSGRVWDRVSNNLSTSLVLPPARWASVAASSGSSEVFAGSGDPNYALSPDPIAQDSSAGQGIWRSLVNGNSGSWTKVSPLRLDGETIFRLRIDPAAPHDVYAATSHGIWKGTHSAGSVTFTRVDGQASNGSIQVFDAGCSDLVVDFDHVNSQGTRTPLLYAGVYRNGSGDKGIWKFDGTSWHLRVSGIRPLRPTSSLSVGPVALAMDAHDHAVLYARIIRHDDGYLLGVFRTSSAAEPVGGGNAWTPLVSQGSNETTEDQLHSYGWYNNVIEVDPTDGRVVVVGGLNPFLSLNSGAQFVACAGQGVPPYGGVHDDVHAIAFHPSGHIVLAGSDGGIDCSTDVTSKAVGANGQVVPTWHWERLSHGMTTAEFYAIGSQNRPLQSFAGGAQDNGSSVTFGNRSWYDLDHCDATSIAMDAQNALTCYTTCLGEYLMVADPVLGTPGTTTSFPQQNPPADVDLAPPFAADPQGSLQAVSGGRYTSPRKAFGIFRSDPGTTSIQWLEVSGRLRGDEEAVSLAISPTPPFALFLAGLRGTNRVEIGVYRGGSWSTVSANIPQDKSPNGVAFDPQNARSCFAAFGGSSGGVVAVSQDGGATWAQATNANMNPLPALTSIVVSPFDGGVVFAGSVVGVLLGRVTFGSTPSIAWCPFDDGMPDAVDVTGLWANGTAGTLTAVTMGFGAFERPIGEVTSCASVQELTCPDPMLLVRDNVFDTGRDPSPSGEPDPEHPVAIANNRYEPDASAPVYWWASTDIRLEAPPGPEGNQVPPPGIASLLGATQASADHVEFEGCPIEHADCPPGTLIDKDPVRGRTMRVHVQVANLGVSAAPSVRVMVLWADAGVGLGPLPADFWSTRFPAGQTTCPAYVGSGDWHAVDPANPSRLLSRVKPDEPAVATFDWVVPSGVTDHCCMIAIVDSPADPIESWIRAGNILDTGTLVPRSRHIAQRNLHVIDVASAITAFGGKVRFHVGNPRHGLSQYDLVVSRASLPDSIALTLELPAIRWLPELVSGAQSSPQGGLPAPAAPTSPRTLKPHVVGATRWVVLGDSAVFPGITLPSETSFQATFSYRCDRGLQPSIPARFSVLERRGADVVGGATYVLRVPSALAKPATTH